MTGRRRRRDADSDADAQVALAAALPPPVPEALVGAQRGGSICTQSRQRVIDVPASFFGSNRPLVWM